MYTLQAAFRPFNQIHIADLFGQTGVYVFWDAHARAKPTYIGEGNVLKRFGDHSVRELRRFARPLDGYVCLIGDRARRMHKEDACMLEYALLRVAAHTDRSPNVNVHSGNEAALRACLRADRTVRIAVTGYDPFCHPRSARPLRQRKEIKSWLDGDEVVIEHDWRLRRLRAPIL